MADISKLNGYNLKDAAARADIAGIKNGTITVGKATDAANANNATVANMALNCYDPSDATKTYTTYTKINELTKTIQDVQNGVCKGYAFNSVDALIGALEAETTNTKYKVGDELYIKTADKPDYWVGEVKETKGAAVTSIADGGTVGYWVLYKLGEKTDLTQYQQKTDAGLNTTVKTVVGAINEVRTTANSANSKVSELTQEYRDMLTAMGYDDTVPDDHASVATAYLDKTLTKHAIYADEASTATNDENGHAITGYIRSLSVSGKTITYTLGNGTTGTLTTQDTTYTLPAATTTVRGGAKVGAVRTSAVTTNAASSTANRYYAVERDSAEKLFVNVPWTDNNTQYQLNVTVSGEEMTIALATK